MAEQKVSFYDYCIATHEGEDSPLGDFVSDMKRDSEFPKTVTGCVHHVLGVGIVPYKENEYKQCVLHHMSLKNACKEAKSAFRKLWKEYNETLKG